MSMNFETVISWACTILDNSEKKFQTTTISSNTSIQMLVFIIFTLGRLITGCYPAYSCLFRQEQKKRSTGGQRYNCQNAFDSIIQNHCTFSRWLLVYSEGQTWGGERGKKYFDKNGWFFVFDFHGKVQNFVGSSPL